MAQELISKEVDGMSDEVFDEDEVVNRWQGYKCCNAFVGKF